MLRDLANTPSTLRPRLVARAAIHFANAAVGVLKSDLALAPGPALVFLAIAQINWPRPQAGWWPATPASAYRVAHNLGLPYETVRRHILQLTASGLCLRLDKGFQLAETGDGAALIAKAAQATWAIAEPYAADLRRLAGADGAHGFAPEALNPLAGTLAAWRHLLRLLEIAMTRYQLDAPQVVMQIAIQAANTAKLGSPVAEQAYAQLEAIPPDSERQAVSIYRLARDLDLAYETARRYAKILIRQGLVLQTATGGLITPQALLERPYYLAAVLDLDAEARAYLQALDQLQAQAAPPRSAAG